LTTDTDTSWLTFVFGAELFGTGVGDALERAAVLVVGAVGVLGATREAGVIGARPTCAGNALLRLGTGSVNTGQQALSVDANARVAALEVELATEGRRVGLFFERIEAKTVVRAGRAERTIVFLFTLADAAKRRAELPDGTVGIRDAYVPLGRRLRVAFVSATQEAAPLAERAIRDADVAGVLVAASNSD
jgi:hypothetical protein